MQLKNLFGSNVSAGKTAFTYKSTLHGCPFCRCRSSDHSLKQINVKPDTSYKLYLGKQFLDSKFKNKSLEGNIYYRAFQSPKKRGLSPNMNKKIIIKYSSPPLNQENLSSKNKILGQLQNSLKQSVFYNDKQKIKKNIYVNQNTPPKSKFLAKRSSSRQKNVQVFKKRNSNRQDKKAQDQPKLIQIESQQIKAESEWLQSNSQLKQIRVLQKQEPSKLGENRFIRYYRFGDNNRLQVSPIKPNLLNNIDYSQSKNAIERFSSPRASSSPYGSVQQSSAQVFPFIFQKSLQSAKQQKQIEDLNNSKKTLKENQQEYIRETQRDKIVTEQDKTQLINSSDRLKTIQKNKSRQNIDYNYSESDINGTSHKKINFHVYNKDSLKNIEQSSPQDKTKGNKQSRVSNNIQDEVEKKYEPADSQLKLSEYELASQLSQDLNLNYDYYQGQSNSDLSISANVAF